MKQYEYKGYTIKHGKFGWYAEPKELDSTKERFGFSINMGTNLDVENWIDDKC